MKIAVLFDGAGLARLGLEQAGHECVGVEIDPAKHHLSTMVGSGNCVMGDAREFDITPFDAVWASPPCQERSDQKTSAINLENANLLYWALGIKAPIVWIENVLSLRDSNAWGTPYNAAQFLEKPLQRRRRLVGGVYSSPHVFREYKADYPKLRAQCPPAMMATEIYKGGYNRSVASERRRFTHWYKIYQGRRPTLFDMAYHQGFELSLEWLTPPKWWRTTQRNWLVQIAAGLGNGVPVYMSKAFGAVYEHPSPS